MAIKDLERDILNEDKFVDDVLLGRNKIGKKRKRLKETKK